MITLIEPGIVRAKLQTQETSHNIISPQYPYHELISFCILIFIQDNGYEWYSWYWSRV